MGGSRLGIWHVAINSTTVGESNHNRDRSRIRNPRYFTGGYLSISLSSQPRDPHPSWMTH